VPALFAGALLSRAADTTVHYQTQPGGTVVRIEGTSTVHEWAMKGTVIGGSVDFPADVVFNTDQAALPGLKDGKLAVAVKAGIPVRSIHSEADHMADTMDQLMQQNMKETSFPKIEFRASELKLKQPRAAGAPFAFDAAGELAIAGVTNKIEFPATIAPAGGDKIKISGSAKVKMSDYKVEPPAPNFGLGLMKCGDEVTITFDWTLARKQP
jgi:polyisoprenoid-binding protein YceI